jgi:hypothetical protein
MRFAVQFVQVSSERGLRNLALLLAQAVLWDVFDELLAYRRPPAVDELADRRQPIRMRFPLAVAVPVILAGVRTSAVLTVGTATLAAFIGAGGLGVPIVAGLQLADTTRILSGALPAALLALVVDRGLAGVEQLLRPRGMS